ncbi:MAG TPA: hypothetical protein VG297_24185, partial [Bryobacteraceae bacterium]|nr:hypothetical protein [Bryobacteraceae bacterium]
DRTLFEKDGKAFSSFNTFNAITDFNTKQTVLLDMAGKRYAKIASDQLPTALAGAMPQMPAGLGSIFASMKVNVSAPKMTGRTATIQGVEAEEQEIVVSIEGPPIPNLPPGPMVREVMQLWFAKSGEVLRVPAIRELTGYSLWSFATTNPAGQLEAMFKALPGMGDLVTQMTKNMQTGVMLRMHVEMFMPSMAQMLRQIPGANNSLAGVDADAPLMQMNQEVVELSSASIPTGQFEIPEGFKEAEIADLIKDMIPAVPAPAPAH